MLKYGSKLKGDGQKQSEIIHLHTLFYQYLFGSLLGPKLLNNEEKISDQMFKA